MDAPFVAASILAHQGGWDEILLVAGPIVLVVGLLGLAKRRIERAQAVTDDRDDVRN